jgi:hypothetical protein
MASSDQKTYRKLAGNGLAVLRHSLWEGSDHLLWVEDTFFHERYKRFYYQDIESVVLQRTGRRTACTLIMGLCLLPFIAIAVFPGYVRYFSIFMAASLAVLMAIQWQMGPGCRVHIQTAVQKCRLSNLVRTKKALKVMDRIRKSVEAVQGPLDDHAASGNPPEAA